jgi:hypothetical protein
MPAEIRHLIFSPPEVTAAIRNYCLRSGQLIPDDVTTRLDVGAENRPIVTISIEGGKHRRPADLQVAGEKLLASLILFCHSKRIPLPVRGTKELCVLHGRLVVVVQLPMPQMLIARAS